MTQLTHAALDAIFEPIGTTTKRPDVGLRVGGVDISNRYMQPSQGGTATAPNTNIKSNGSDIATLFTELGTATSPLSVSATTPVSGSCTYLFGSGCTATTSSTATPTGGSGTYTYSWAFVSGDSTITIANGATSATCTFTQTAGDGFYSAVYRVTVNDGTTTATADVSITLNHLFTG